MELTIGKNEYYDDTQKKNVVLSLETFDKKNLLSSGKRSSLRSKDVNHCSLLNLLH